MGFGGPHAGYLAVRAGPRAPAARPPGRRLRRRRRRAGLPAGAADPRAAHPPGEGHLQHLHRAGAAGRHGRACTPSTTAPTGCAAIARRVHRHAARARRRAARRRASSVVARRVLRHRHRARCPAGPPRSSPRPRDARRQPAPRRRRPRRRSPATRPPTASTVERGAGPRSASTGRRRRSSTPRRADALPAGAARARATYLTHPVFHRTAPRPRCCATCAASPTRTYALDRGMIPLGLVHHEAQRHRRDGADHLAGVRRPAPVRAGRRRPRATAS